MPLTPSRSRRAALAGLLTAAAALLPGNAAHAVAPAAYGTIAGTVSLGATGTPNGGGFVSLYRLAENGYWTQIDDWGTTGADGHYEFAVPAGSYRVRFWAPIDYLEEYWTDAATADAGQDVVIAADQVTADVDAVLDPTELSNLARPAVVGTRRVGAVLTASSDTWAPATVTRSWQWFRGSTAIAGAVGRTYTARAADLGKALSVRVTATTARSGTAAATSAPTTPIARGTLHLTSSAKITGTARVGRWLRAVRPTASPSATATYRWLRNGKAIKGATQVRYHLKAADRRKRIGVRITLVRAGYTTVTKVVTRPSAVR